jgi:hypothetical protein
MQPRLEGFAMVKTRPAGAVTWRSFFPIKTIGPWSQMNADETVRHIRSPPASKQCSLSTSKPNFTGASILSASAAGTVALNT